MSRKSSREGIALGHSSRKVNAIGTCKRIATHLRPDPDALVSAWLAERFLFAGQPAEILFVNYNSTPEQLADVDCVVDLGGVYSTKKLRFDHKEPAFADRHATCAAKLVWEYLCAQKHSVAYLADLVHLIHDGDTPRLRSNSLAYKRSRASGLHAVYHRLRIFGVRDGEAYRKMRVWLDRHHLAEMP